MKQKYIKRISIFLFSLAVLFFAANSSNAAINSQINYQGKLTNASYVAEPDGNYNMIISIYDEDSGGNCVWTARGTCGSPTPRAVAVVNGIFSIMLGDTGAGDNALTGLDFNAAYYLGVTVGSDAEMTPRKPIGAAGYAFNSNMLNGLTSNTSGANAHILATDSSGNATISGSTYFNGTTYYVNSSGTGNLNGMTLAGDIDVKGADITNTTGALTITPLAGNNLNIALSGAGDFAVNTNQLYVDTSTGNVGIGNSSPSLALHIGTTASTNLGSTANSLMVSGGLEVAGSAYLGPMQFPTNSGAISWIDMPVSAAATPNAVESYTARVGGTDILTVYGLALGSGAGGIVSGSGRVGIGTNTPGALFHIATSTTASGATVFEQASADADPFDLIIRKARGTIASPTVITTGDELGNIRFSGYSGAGGYVTSASIKAVSEGTVATTRVPGALTFSTGTDAAPTVLTERMRITSGGNIGIGDSSPLSLFTVGNGDLFQINSSGQIAAVAGYTQGSGNFSISGAGVIAQSYTGVATAATIAANSLTGGSILSLSSTSTAAAAGNTGLNVAISGANGTAGITRYGLQSAVTATNGTSGTNIAGYFSASGATTANYGLIVANGNVGIGTAVPDTTLALSAAGGYGFLGRSHIKSSADGYITLFNNAENAFTMLRLGGATASFPGIKRNGTALNFRLADDSADAAITSAGITTSGTTLTFTGAGGITAGGTNQNVTLTPSGTGYTLLNGNVGIGISSPTALLHLTGSAGKVSLEINSNETTAASNVLMLRSDLASDDDAIFRVQADGAVYADGAYAGTGADYAEYFYTNDIDLKSGEVVCVDVVRSNSMKRCERSGDNNVMGVVSTKPAVIGNGGSDKEKNPNYKIVGMIGQVPGLVTNENGSIEIGDSLTSASDQGYMRKANAGESTVGVAMENFKTEKGKIQILISRRNQSLTVEKVEQTVSENIASMEIQDKVDNIVSQAMTNLDNQISEIADSQQIQMSLANTQISGIQVLQEKIQKQMNLIAEEAKAASDFIVGLDVKNIVYKDTLGNINILEGKMTAKDIEAINGIRAKDIEAIGSIKGSSLGLGSDVSGTASIKAGEEESDPIKTKEVNSKVRIYITPKDSTEGKTLYYEEKDIKDKESFTVKIDSSMKKDVEFNWLIIK